MKKYALRRLLQLIPILFAITFLSYGMMRIAGSDVVTQKMENTGQVVSEDTLNAAREQLGLDKPFLTQYFVWLGKLLRGDMGNSYDQAFRFLIRLYRNFRLHYFLQLHLFCLQSLYLFLWEFCQR